MKNLITSLLPEKLATLIISWGKQAKRFYRGVARGLKYGQRPYTVTVPGLGKSFKIVLDPYHNGTVDEVVANTRAWENEIDEVLLSFLADKKGVFLDIGANIGYHSLLIATHLRDTVSVHSFEPIPALVKQIKQSAELNELNNLTLHNVALGEGTSEQTMFVRGENIGGSSLLDLDSLDLSPVSAKQTISIVCLDSFLPILPGVDLIKIDVEGYELEALRGGRTLLQKYHPTIVIEFSPMFYKLDYANKSLDLINYLNDLGYKFYQLDNTPLDLTKWLQDNPDATQIDIICK